MTLTPQALLHANSNDKYRHVVTSTAGIVFLGSPLHGSEFQSLAKIVAWVSRFAGSHDGIVRDLACDDENLMDTLHQFCMMSNTLSITLSCFFEQYPTNYSLLGQRWSGNKRVCIARTPTATTTDASQVVDEASACIPGLERIALAANHSEMNKYSGPNDSSFQSVSAELRRLCAGAPDVVQCRIKRMSSGRNDLIL